MVLVEERNDDVLGKHWSWSHRNLTQVNSSQHRMKVMNGCVYFHTKKSKRRGVSWIKVEQTGERDINPLVMMAVVTRFPEIVSSLEERYRDLSNKGNV